MYLYGASGHGRVIKEIIESRGEFVDAFIDDNSQIQTFVDKRVLHVSDDIDTAIVSIGDNTTRKKVVGKLNCKFGVAIHPTAIISKSASIGEGTVVMAGAIINAGAVIGKHCIVNTGASIDHECIVDDYAHVAPHATLCGQVHVGEGALVGVGSSVIPCVKIGAWSVVGAGSAVIRDVAENVTVIGVPAREI